MPDWLKFMLSGIGGAILVAAPALMWLGGLDARVKNLEQEVKRLSAPKQEDAVRLQCARLAEKFAAPNASYLEQSKLSDAMNGLGCSRSN